MSVDYDGVGGIGIKLTDEMIEKIIESGFFTQDEWEKDEYDCIEKSGILYSSAGNSYSSNTYYYLFVNGKNLIEINQNEQVFRDKLKGYGIILKTEDLKVIEDFYVY